MADEVKAETPTTPTPAEVKASLVDVSLNVEFRTNDQIYGPGIVKVPPDVAVDLQRRQAEYDRVEKERLISRTVTVDGGTLDAAGK